MINKRLIALGEKKVVAKVVLCQWISMILNVCMIFRLAYQIREFYLENFNTRDIILTVIILVLVVIFRGILKQISSKNAHLAGAGVKAKVRTKLYEKLLNLGATYTKKLSTAEIMQVSCEGVDQLETYFGSYLPQFFYCMIAPITLFLIVAPIDLMTAMVLFICVPLIPISIIIIQKIAKKLLAKYWGLYTALGDNFLENVQGMTTLKIYEADEKYHKEMNKSAENFRIITMKVLSMQLNSIIVMDTVAYGGAALGGILGVTALASGNIDIFGAVVIILIASEFFLPMRALGSFFHIAMNGMAAADKMFKILDMEEPKDGNIDFPSGEICIKAENLSFSYSKDKKILEKINFEANVGLTSLVGISGSGKSTIASILSLKEIAYHGSIKISHVELSEISRKSLRENITRVSDNGYIFSGTVFENMQMASENATENEMIEALKKVRLWDFLSTQNGLLTKISDRGSNFSGGQRQRLNIARALLRDSKIYIFDEVTSNIDSESEDAILSVIFELAKSKTIIFISHRLANVVCSNQILFLKNGEIMERGTHEMLLKQYGNYAKLFLEQKSLERYREGENA